MDAVSFVQTSANILLAAVQPEPSWNVEILAILANLQTEIIVGVLALLTHFLFFHNSQPAPHKKGLKEKTVLTAPAVAGVRKTPCRGANTARHKDVQLLPLKAAIKAGDLKEVMIHFEALQSMFQQNKFRDSKDLMTQIVQLIGRKGAMSDFLRLVVKLDLLEHTMDYIIAYCFSEENNVDTVLLQEVEELGREQGVTMSTAAYHAFLRGAASNKSQLDLQRLMSQAQRSGVADFATYNFYLHSMMKSRHPKTAEGKDNPRSAWCTSEIRKTLEDMRLDGHQLSLVAFNKLLQSAISSPPGNVWVIIDEMHKLKVKPDKVTCSTILKSRFVNKEAGNIERVFREVMDHFDDEVDEVLFKSLADACVRCGSADLLMPFLVTKSCSTGGKRWAHTYASVIRAYGQVHDIRGAWKTWKEMLSNNIAPITVTVGCMMEALCTNGEINGAYELMQDLRNKEETAHLVNASGYGSILKAFSKQNDFTRMWEVYNVMTSLKLEFSAVTYNILLDSCSRSGDLQLIPQLLNDMDAQGIKMGIMAYSAILKAYCHKNLLNQAFELLRDMTETAGLVPDEVIYNTMLDGCACNCQFERGMDLYHQMKESGVKPSTFTLAVLVKLANRCAKLDKAFALCDELPEAYGFKMNIHIFDNLIQACTFHNSLPRALDTLERMGREGVKPSARTYQLLLQGCIADGNASDFDGLLRTAMGLPGAPQRFAQFKGLMPPQGGMLNNPGLRAASGRPEDFVSEMMRSLIRDCKEEKLAVALIYDLGKVPGLKLDPRLRLQLMNTSRNSA